MLTGHIIALIPCIYKEEKSQVSNLSLQLKKIEKEEQTKPEAIRRKEIINMTTEIIDTESRKITEKPKADSLQRSIKLIKL